MKKLLRLISSMWTSPPVRLRKCLVVKTPPKPPPTMTTLCLVSSDNGGGSDAFVRGAGRELPYGLSLRSVPHVSCRVARRCTTICHADPRQASLGM